MHVLLQIQIRSTHANLHINLRINIHVNFWNVLNIHKGISTASFGNYLLSSRFCKLQPTCRDSLLTDTEAADETRLDSGASNRLTDSASSLNNTHQCSTRKIFAASVLCTFEIVQWYLLLVVYEL